MPTALRLDHLSRVAFVSRGASAALQDQGIGSVGELARRAADDAAFDAHQELRATRTVVAGRAAALQTPAGARPARGRHVGGDAALGRPAHRPLRRLRPGQRDHVCPRPARLLAGSRFRRTRRAAARATKAVGATYSSST